jgi:hypothetical protein
MTDRLLPEEFADLEVIAEAWCLPNEVARYAKRLASSMSEMQALYDAVLPRAEDAIKYCEQFPLDELPEDAYRLLQLLYALIIVSFPVELLHQPQVPDTGAAQLNFDVEPVP